jgi:uncharacterized protein YegL
MSQPMAAPKETCLPTYLVLDTSTSMKPYEDLLNNTLEHVYVELKRSPRVSEFAHICIISFNTQPHVVQPMTDLGQTSAIPILNCSGGTQYGVLFDELRQLIEADVGRLSTPTRRVLRPAVFLLTDGAPQDKDTWRTHFAPLASSDWKLRPHIIAYSFGNASEQVIRDLAPKVAFRARDSAAQGDAVAQALISLLNTVVYSASAGRLEIPSHVNGFDTIVVPNEYVG